MSIELRCYNCDSDVFRSPRQSSNTGELPENASVICAACGAKNWLSDFERESSKAEQEAAAVLDRYKSPKPFG